MKQLSALALGFATVLAPALDHAVAQGTLPTDSARGVDLPVGKGQLSREALTLRLRAGNLDILFVPLEERVLRLLAPDSYQSLENLLKQKRLAIDSAAMANGMTNPGIALVTFHATAPNTRFDPQLLMLSLHGQQTRAGAVLPMTPTLGNQQLDTRDVATGLFLYRRDIPVMEPFAVTYLDATSDDWGTRLQRINSERTRILGRARADSGHVKP